MANIIWAESGSDATQDLSFWQTFGTVASATDQHFTGPRSIKLTSSGAATSKLFQTGLLADAGRRISFRLFVDALPDANIKHIFDIETSGFATCFGVELTTAGHLAIYNNAFSVQATGSSTLAINTWYRITITYTITSGAVNSVTVFLNGVSEVTATNITMTTASSVFLTQITQTGTQHAWYDDFFIDDGTSGDPGNIQVTAKRPFSNGSSNAFPTQIGAGGSGYGTGHAPQVNEQPLSTTNGWSTTATTNTVEEYTVEGATVGDVNISGATIVGINGWVYANASGSLNVSMIVVNNNNTIGLTTSNTMYTFGVTTSTYPVGNTDVGMNSGTTAGTKSLYECGLLIAYIPSSRAHNLLTLLGTG